MSIVTPQSANLVDTIGIGYQAINRRPWLLGLPAGLSAYVWLESPRALAELTGSLREGVRAAVQLIGGAGTPQEPFVQQVLHSGVGLLASWLNLVPLHLSERLVANPAPASGLRLVIALLVASLAMLLLNGLFLTLLAGAVAGERFAVVATLRHALRLSWRIALYLLAVLGVGLIMGLPFLALSALVIAALPVAVAPVLAAWYVALFWAYVYTGFAPEAILISRVGPLRAIYHSVNVVRRNLLATLGLLLLSFVIVSGFGVVWRQLGDSPGSMAAAILGSAYVGSGLSAARLYFYRERLARWRPQRGAI